MAVVQTSQTAKLRQREIPIAGPATQVSAIDACLSDHDDGRCRHPEVIDTALLQADLTRRTEAERYAVGSGSPALTLTSAGRLSALALY